MSFARFNSTLSSQPALLAAMSAFKTGKLWLKGAQQITSIRDARREAISVAEILNRCDPEKWSEPVSRALAAINNEVDSQETRLQAAHQLFSKVLKDDIARQCMVFSMIPPYKLQRVKSYLAEEHYSPFPFYTFRLKTANGKILKSLPPDPIEVPLSFYRMGEARKAMQSIEEGKVVIVPGFTGTGKSGLFTRSVTRLAHGKGMSVKYIEEFKELMQEPRHYDDDPLLDPDTIPDNSLVILDECALSFDYDAEGYREKFAELRQIFSELLERGVSLIFMGGGWFSAAHQERRITKIVNRYLNIPVTLCETIPLYPKMLSVSQIEEFLFVGQHDIPLLQQRFYASIIRHFVPHYLRALFLFRKKKTERTIKELLDRVEKDMKGAGLKVAFIDARIEVAPEIFVKIEEGLTTELRRHLEILQRPKGK